MTSLTRTSRKLLSINYEIYNDNLFLVTGLYLDPTNDLANDKCNDCLDNRLEQTFQVQTSTLCSSFFSPELVSLVQGIGLRE